MEKLKNIVTITLALFAALIMVFLPKSECQIKQPPPLVPRPLCASQFSLANYACAMVPAASEPSPPSLNNGLDEELDDDADDDEEEEHHHNHNHNHNHQHRHRGYRHNGKHHLPQNIDNCCRWISQIDSGCVCELLFYLPGFATFLMRPLHDFTVEITDSCNVTYSCGGVQY
ncbi:uncharacterized protein LOC118349238 [Juglans regia]|uniref:Uncharacterized protein LOC109021297 n=1 Tax=Juglans regia TaxID=51240 RepID=A0A2I4HTH5_JUGRE|nr:uncharacterized protein LOC109021297 [Juglans regia]XP_035548825.1 uncharacterized protein LOC118349238 [Juglans regia]